VDVQCLEVLESVPDGIRSVATILPESRIAQRNNLSFSWYCRRPAEANVGAEVRMGDAICGRATVESTRPACAGTAAATLRNMIVVGVWGVVRYRYRCRF
jgi:hypothetical protein